MTKSFGSDNHSGVHPLIMQALIKANEGDCNAYGNDDYTAEVLQKICATLGAKKAFFVLNGTGANITSLRALAQSYNAIICSDAAHIRVDECGGTEKNVGSKLLPITTKDGKITVDGIAEYMHRFGEQHAVQPKVVSITQPTEWGTLYSLQEIRAITDYAHAHKLLVHIDGARLYNAAAALNCSLKELTADTGIDVLSMGGAKNGLMFGEAVVFFNEDLARDFQYIRMQTTQLISKMRFIAAQFDALLTNNLWHANASSANNAAHLLAQELTKIGVKLTQKQETNAVFARLPLEKISEFQKKYRFYTWNEKQSIVRFMASFNTTENDVQELIGDLKKCI